MIDPTKQRRSRRALLLIALIFAAPFLVALVLTIGGWQPSAEGNGQPIKPQRNFAQEHLVVRLENGSTWPWRDSQPRLTLVALAGPGCAAHCLQTLTGIAEARLMLNRNQSRLRLLYLGEPPHGTALAAMRNYWQLGTDVDGKLAAYRPSTPDSVSAVLVESNGTALAFYPAGSDTTGLMRDLQKVIK